MENLAKTAISILLGWFPTIIHTVWSGLNRPDGNGFFSWLGHHLIPVFLILCLIGVAADTVVYCLRWKPLTVWKSFFRRKGRRSADSLPDDETGETAGTGITDTNLVHYPVLSANYMKTDRYALNSSAVSGPETESGNNRNPETMTYTEPVSRVPDKNEDHRSVSAPVHNGYVSPGTVSPAQPYGEKTIGPRRRRIRMHELFGEAEDSHPHYEPPKPVVDRNRAYHQPVYPRNWKGNRDSTK